MPRLADSELTDWPPATGPEGAAVFAHNAVLTVATVDQAWRRLVRAADWPHWYPNSCRVQLPDGQEELAAEMVFSWTTFANRITSQVTVFEPPHRLEWTWWRRGGYGYHRWLVAPGSGGLTRVLTEETHRGPVPTLLSFALQPALRLSHEIWLRRLARLAPMDG